jgi:hypothetical protein
MRSHTKRFKSRVAEQRTKELHDRFNNNQMTTQELLYRLSFIVANKKIK